MRRQVVVVDNFLENPDELRELALQQNYEERGSKGVRSEQFTWEEIYKPAFEKLLGVKISSDDFGPHSPVNACFQWCHAETPVVIHSDAQQFAGALYLTPNAPPESGTSFYEHKVTKARTPSSNQEEMSITFADGNLFDRTKWTEVDRIGNIYNRLTLWNGQAIHSASVYFGKGIEKGRLFQVFFFNAEDPVLPPSTGEGNFVQRLVAPK